ncbi:hypothetical protein [Acinetobacter variabilis]
MVNRSDLQINDHSIRCSQCCGVWSSIIIFMLI